MRHRSIRSDDGVRQRVATEQVEMPAMHDSLLDAPLEYSEVGNQGKTGKTAASLEQPGRVSG